MKYCHNCNTIWNKPGQPARRESCVKCAEDLHVCLNCRFYDSRKNNQCLSHTADPIIKKDRSNFCDEFYFIDRALPEKNKNKVVEARNQWEKLFKK